MYPGECQFHYMGDWIPGNSNTGGDRILKVSGTTAKDIRIDLEAL
ncbi:hypothetical protein KSC_057760 [Ktedonobacter sp. SOSP1-52]|nr:hypothetical protein KSC_057760 [Ktedonobacter sp. SOSP1-52]